MIEAHLLTPARWQDFEAVFRAPGCAVARGCWCMYYRESGRQEGVPGLSPAAARHAAMQRLAATGPAPGLIGYRDGMPVGWVSLGPREYFPRLRRSPVARPLDDRKAWSIVCFVVPKPHRRQGIAAGLLQAAIAHARREGATLLEAYPIDRPGPARDDALWNGTKSLFDRAGFAEGARRKPGRPVMRLEL